MVCCIDRIISGGHNQGSGLAGNNAKRRTAQREMNQSVQIGNDAAANPESLLARSLKTGVAEFTFGTQGADSFETEIVVINPRLIEVD